MGVKIFSCMGTLRIMKVQLAKITVTLLLIGHVTGQLIPYGSSSLVFTRQRNAWQEQIERVMKAEEELRRKALAGSPRSYTLADSIPATKEKYDTNEKIGPEEKVKVIIEDKIKPIKLEEKEVFSVTDPNKSSYILEAERFLAKFKSKSSRKPAVRTNYKFETTKRPIVAALKKKETRGKKTTSKYLEQAENILRNIKSGNKIVNRKKTDKVFERPYKLMKDSNKEKLKQIDNSEGVIKNELAEDDIKSILNENLDSKEGLKEIIKTLLKQTLGI